MSKVLYIALLVIGSISCGNRDNPNPVQSTLTVAATGKKLHDTCLVDTLVLPTQVTNVEVTHDGRTITVTWGEPHKSPLASILFFTHYEIQYKKAFSDIWLTVDNRIEKYEARNHMIEGLQNLAYHVRVRAYDSLSNEAGIWSAIATASPPEFQDDPGRVLQVNIDSLEAIAPEVPVGGGNLRLGPDILFGQSTVESGVIKNFGDEPLRYEIVAPDTWIRVLNSTTGELAPDEAFHFTVELDSLEAPTGPYKGNLYIKTDESDVYALPFTSELQGHSHVYIADEARNPVFHPMDDDLILYAGNENTWGIYAASSDGTGKTLLTPYASHGATYAPVWSPDGTEIAYVSFKSGHAEVWVMEADGSSPRQITRDRPDRDTYATWPLWYLDKNDHFRLAYFNLVAGQLNLRSIDKDGIGSSETIFTNAYTHAVTIEGRRIAAYSTAAYSTRLLIKSFDSARVDTVIARATPDEPTLYNRGLAWSPDGTRLAYMHNDDLYVLEADMLVGRKLENGPVGPPTWMPDSERLVYSKPTRGLCMVAADGMSEPVLISSKGDLALSSTSSVDSGLNSPIRAPSVSPNGRHIVFTRFGWRPTVYRVSINP